MKKIYLTEQYCSEFGQTEAGSHASVGAERLIASAPLSASAAEAEAFMRAANLLLVITEPHSAAWRSANPWRDSTLRAEVPLPATLAGFRFAVQLTAEREGHMPYVSPAFGPHTVRVCEESEFGLASASVQYDAANLSYQRALLAGRA